jgi:hypothetical protein
MSLESEITQQPTEKKVEEKSSDSLPNFLKAFQGAPTQEQIEQWKMRFGDVFVSGFSETELFVWRPLTRPEWINLQITASNPEANITHYKLEEMVCDTCVLWKSITRTWADGKAGTPTSLHEQILQNSNFLTPQAASLLVAKL